MKYLVGIDIGTSGTKVALFDCSGTRSATADTGSTSRTTAGRRTEDGGRRSAGTAGGLPYGDPRPGVGFSGRMRGWSCSL